MFCLLKKISTLNKVIYCYRYCIMKNHTYLVQYMWSMEGQWYRSDRVKWNLDLYMMIKKKILTYKFN